jgi:hypothetical protein
MQGAQHAARGEGPRVGLREAALALSVLLNAVLLAQLGGAGSAGGAGGAGGDARLIERVGSLFCASKVSELLMPSDVQAALRFDNASWEREEPVTAVDLLSVRLSAGERAAGALSPARNAELAERMERHGVAVLPAALDPALCREVAEQVHAEIFVSGPQAEFGPIVEKEFRKDYPLSLEGPFAEMLRRAVRLLLPALDATLGPGAVLREFSALNAYPGAKAQRFHPDSTVDHADELVPGVLARLYSVFVYLDDVDNETAPFDVFPGTHTHFHFLPQAEREVMTSMPFARLAVPQGSIAVYDSRTRHRGGPNVGQRARPTLYFSFLGALGKAPDGPTYSLRRGYEVEPVRADVIASGEPLAARALSLVELGHDDQLCISSLRARCPLSSSPRELFACAVALQADPANSEEEDEDVVQSVALLDILRKRAAREQIGEAVDEATLLKEDEMMLEALEWGPPRNRTFAALALPGCALRSRLEWALKLGPFAPGKLMDTVSWGRLGSSSEASNGM